MPEGAVRRWHPEAAATGSDSAVAPAARSVEDMLPCQPARFAVAILDSLLFERLIQRNRFDALILAGPARVHFLADHLDAASESGIESIVRFRLALAGVVARIQAVFRKRYRLDLEIDGCLVLEIDGWSTHAQDRAFTRDRVRAAVITRDGRVVLRFADATAVHDWDFVLASVLDVMRQHAPVR